MAEAEETIGTDLAEAGAPTLLEHALPFRELSFIAQVDRRSRDPAYAAHSWFARRPPGVMRGLLLASALSARVSSERFWQCFESAEPLLAGMRAHDPFAGGGTILVEAARLGACASGIDVDPLAVQIVRHELNPPSPAELGSAVRRLLRHLEGRASRFYAATGDGWTPLHYFFLHIVACPDCGAQSALHRDLIIARDLKKHGAVVRDEAVVAFCPDCYAVHRLASSARKEIRCCGRRHVLARGNYDAQKFKCPQCAGLFMHAALKTGQCARRLIAVEETHDEHRRRIRAATNMDRKQVDRAKTYIARYHHHLALPKGSFAKMRVDERPRSYGVTRYQDLFGPRQLATFGAAFAWVDRQELTAGVKAALFLALSNALATNNRLCGYARDYGRIAPLFSVRGYALPALAVELNPFHPSAGRGTLARIFARLERSCMPNKVRRYVWDQEEDEAIATSIRFPRLSTKPDIRCASASKPIDSLKNSIDVCVFDPPYFDYIAYSELSEFYRSWLRKHRLGGTPLFPDSSDPVSSFGEMLGDCLAAVRDRVKAGRPIAFTYHSASDDAWKAIGHALDRAELLVTALWPLRNDVHMGHHTASGNCEWDVVVVCRRTAECERDSPPQTVEDWRAGLSGLPISEADERGLELALSMAAERFGVCGGTEAG